MEGINVAIAQINTSVGDVEGNCKKIIDYINRAKDQDAEMVIFPEMAVSGYPVKDLLLSDEFLKDCEMAQRKIQEASKGIVVVVGGIEREGGKLYNTAFVFNNGDRVYGYHKRHLPNYDVFDEKRYFASGKDDGIFEIFGKKIAVNICEDIWIKGGPADRQAEAGAELIINISASPFHYGKTEIRQEMIKDHIARGGVPIVYVNQIGGQDDLVFDGESYAFSGRGKMLAQAKHFEQDLVVVNTNGKEIEPRKQTVVEEVYDALTLGLRDYVRKNGFEKVVLGLSGGVDSALVAAIAADALSPENVMCILMPSRYSSAGSVTDAEKLCANYGITYETIAIEPAHNAFAEMLAPFFRGTAAGTAEENIQARIRMVNLYAIANKFGSLVLNTSNKSEAAVGYGTVYGDMAGDLSVIGDVPKLMVYDLCRHANALAGYDKIPENILTKEPSAELKENQRDKDSLPDYDTLDRIVHGYVEEIKSPVDIGDDLDKQVLKDVVRRIDASENKRVRSSPQIKVTPRAFGTGRRMPIANGYRHKIVN